MANEQIINPNTSVVASTNPNNNLAQLQGNNAINIPLQITPVVTQPNQLQANRYGNIPTPVATPPQVNNYNNTDFQIIKVNINIAYHNLRQ